MSLVKNIKFDLIFVVLFVVYTITILFLFPNKDNLFWVSYLFTIIAFIIQFIVAYLLTNNNPKSNFNSYPLFTVCVLYLILQIIVSIVLLNYNVVLSKSIVIQTILLGVFMIVEIMLFQSKEHIETVEMETANSTMFIDNVRKDLEILSNQTEGEVKAKIDDLKDNVRYSNPVSSKQVIPIENNFLDNLNELKLAVSQSNYQNVSNICDNLNSLLSQRNILLKK